MTMTDVALNAADRRLLERLRASAEKIAAIEKERERFGSMLEEARERGIPVSAVSTATGLNANAIRQARWRRRQN